MKKSVIWLCAALFVLGVTCSAIAQGPRRGPGQGRPEPLKIGQVAPDVELQKLIPTEDAEGTTTYAVTDETFKLSELRDDQVACVFLSSYT